MENGGNAVVNSIFEAHLAQSGKSKPTNLADGPTRERFIRDKYERRKYFDAAGYSNVGRGGMGIPQSPSSGPGMSPSRGTPSDVARQRVANRQARMRPAHSQMEEPVTAAPASRPPIAQAPVSAPVVFDLLDFGDSPSPAPASSAPPVHDPFAPSATSVSDTPDPFLSQPPSMPPPSAPQQIYSQTPAPSPAGTFGHEFLTPAPAPQAKPPASNDTILALFNTPPPATSFATGPSAMNHSNMAMMGGQSNNSGGGMMPQQMMMNQNMMGMQNVMMNYQHPGQAMGGMNPQMTGMMNNQNNVQHLMMNQHQQSNQMNMNMMMQGNPQMMGGTMNGIGNTNFNAMMQGMQQMNMGNQQSQSFAGGDSGFGTPMGGSAPTTKDDPFSSLGGMNAFR